MEVFFKHDDGEVLFELLGSRLGTLALGVLLLLLLAAGPLTGRRYTK